jgi:DNA-directed RNA polymerase specialized sigma24 family protein
MKNTFYNNIVKSKRRSEVIADEDLDSPNLILSSIRNTGESKFAMEDIHKALGALRPAYRLLFRDISRVISMRRSPKNWLFH